MHLLVAAFLSVGTPLPFGLDAAVRTDYAEALTSARSTQKPLVVLLEDLSRPSRQVDQVRGHASNLQENAEFCVVDVSTAYGRKVAKSYRESVSLHRCHGSQLSEDFVSPSWKIHGRGLVGCSGPLCSAIP